MAVTKGTGAINEEIDNAMDLYNVHIIMQNGAEMNISYDTEDMRDQAYDKIIDEWSTGNGYTHFWTNNS